MPEMKDLIQCLPLGICSWNFSLSGKNFDGQADFNWMSEQGRLRIRDQTYEISKNNPFSGKWTMTHSGRSVLEAYKTNPFTSSFEIHGYQKAASLRAVSAFGRSMAVSGSGVSALIHPAHAFTRRSSITGEWESLETVLFAFWLTVTLWNRQASAASNASVAAS